MKQWYESLFEKYGEQYDREPFTKGTVGECDFIEKEIGYDKSKKILDIGCGTGRHSLELACRGYKVTGVDLSASQIAKANQKALEKGLNIDFRIMDARELHFEREYDMVIMLCEGAFPLMETDEMNYQILSNAAKALKRGGKFIFTTLNALFPLFHSTEKFHSDIYEEGNARSKNFRFDLMTFREYDTTKIEDDSGKTWEFECNERYYTPSEINWLLKSLGFNVIDIYGAKLGSFSRNDELQTDDFEMLVIAEFN